VNDDKASDSKIAATWWIEPRSPLVFRTGQVGLHGSAGKEVFDFPVPGTIAGAVRAAYADANDWDLAQEADHRRLVESIEVQGPILASERLQGDGLKVFFPKPADAVYLKESDAETVCTAFPERVGTTTDENCDLPHGDLQPVVLDANVLAKPITGPEFWTQDLMELWLLGEKVVSKPEECGVATPPRAIRIHVQMDRERRTHKDEGLFESAGLDFAPRVDKNSPAGSIWDHRQYGMLVKTSVGKDLPKGIAGRVRRVGADGRTAYFASTSGWPTIPDKLREALNALKPGSTFRLVLVTPAIFTHGWRLGLLSDIDLTGSLPELPTVRVKLIAATVDRWKAYSGWDMTPNGGGQRAIRRLVPAGAVYWFELLAGRGEDIAHLWLRPISDLPEDRDNGFGLVLPGIARTRRG
jgi:CRISPR-associated protein Cmr3